MSDRRRKSRDENSLFKRRLSLIKRKRRIYTETKYGVLQKECCELVEEGGLGIISFSNMCKAFAIKNWWNIGSTNSLWAKFMRNKYAHKVHPSECKQSCGVFATWRRILVVHKEAERHIRWVIGRGDINFWKDKWVGDDRLADLISPPQQLVESNVKNALT